MGKQSSCRYSESAGGGSSGSGRSGRPQWQAAEEKSFFVYMYVDQLKSSAASSEKIKNNTLTTFLI